MYKSYFKMINFPKLNTSVQPHPELEIEHYQHQRIPPKTPLNHSPVPQAITILTFPVWAYTNITAMNILGCLW